ncbi:hypothetical protein [Aureimonas frigidaquae]|uniref:hypothetical protein n=1 Tax=Aureimonas frigidaquae TaxID=424757 RepID=UPI000A6BF748|nr:hypothetical protein [Aureimonas frigidaquae]
MEETVHVAGSVRPYTTKQMGDACEMLIAAELTLAGVPAMKAPDFWPGYDVIAQPVDRPAQRISVKARTRANDTKAFRFHAEDAFDWIAFVLIPATTDERRRIFIVPSDIARTVASRAESGRQRMTIARVIREFGQFENNFALQDRGSLD